MNSRPEVSVIMSVCNGGLYLADAIESILHQTFTNFEFIIVDDGSIDNSKEIISSFRDERIIAITNVRNLGLAASLNKGADIAKGEYLARMDADDISLPERLQKQKKYLDQHSTVGVLGTDVQFINDHGHVIDHCKNMQHTAATIRWSLVFNNPMYHPTIMMRKDHFFQAGEYSSEFRYSQDYNLWIRMLKVTDFNNLPEILLKYRIHSSNISTQHQQGQLINSIENSRAYLSEQIGREITSKQASLLRRQRTADNDYEVFEAIRIIRDLFYSAINDDQFTEEDRNFVRRDAWRRIFLFSKTMKKTKNRFAGFYTAYKVYPYLTTRRLFSAFFRTLKNRYSQTHLHRGLL